MAVGTNIARAVLLREASRKKCNVYDLKSDDYKNYHMTSAEIKKKCVHDEGELPSTKEMAKCVNDELEEAKGREPLNSDVYIKEHVQSQQWPNLSVIDTKERGMSVFTGADIMQKNSVLCDYHGNIIKKQEGDKIIKSRSKPDSEYNYLLFFRDPRTSAHLCVDGVHIPCDCHPEIPSTIGRYINHSVEKANVRVMAKHIDGDLTVLMIANQEIEAGSELFWNYGVRTYEDGEKIEWYNT